MIVDCFPFFNELDILDIRLNILNEVVDKFVLVEASKTQSKIDKPFYFEQNKNKYSKFLDKIIHVKIEDFPTENGWAMENFQRNCIQKGLHNLNLNDDDVIGISDVDEIWNPILNLHFNEILNKNTFFSAKMKYFVFYLNLETVNKTWTGTIFTKFKNLRQYSAQDLRNKKDHVVFTENSGWHFGYQGGKEIVYNKYLSCIEPIDKSKLPIKEEFFREFDDRIKDGGSFIFSDNLKDESIKLEKIKNINILPKYLVDNKLKYGNMFI